MTAAIVDIVIEQGATLALTFTWQDQTETPVDLTGYSARMQIRETYDSDDYIVSLDDSPGGGITLGGPLGSISIEIPSAITSTIPLMSAVYDIELESAGGVVTRFMQGAALISREVTR